VKRYLARLPGYTNWEKISSTATFRHSLVTFIGTVINGGLGAAFYIVVARFLGPSTYGLLSVSLVTLTLVSDIGDLGTSTGLVRFVGKYVYSEPGKAYRFLKLGLKIKLFVGLFIMILGWIFAPYIAGVIFSKVELTTPLRIAFIGSAGYLLFTFATSVLQALQRFWAWSGLQIASNGLRLILVILIFYLGFLGVNSALILNTVLAYLGFLVSILLLLPKGFIKVNNENSVAKELFHYNKWVTLFAAVSAIGARLDTFISARLLTAVEIGIYAAASQLVQIVPQIVVAISTVVAPRMAGMGDIKALLSYMKKVQIMVLGLAFLGLASIPVVIYIIPLLYGNAYLESIPAFIILLIGMLAFTISIPVHNSIFYYFSYPKFFFFLSVAHLLLVAILGFTFIPIYGVIGAALTFSIGQIFNFIVPTIWFLRKIHHPQITIQ